MKLTKDQVQNLITTQEVLNKLEEQGLINGDEACDKFGDLLYDQGLDYETYCDLIDSYNLWIRFRNFFLRRS